jgi:murein DD-endopeptidase MepM/ murein hydrolase activator NlpD
MSVDATPGAHEAAAQARPDAEPGANRQRLAELATEFEALLLTQMLREMRQASRWEGEDEQNGLGSPAALFDAIDVELARGLARARSLGLREDLIRQVAPSQTPGAGELPSFAGDAMPAPAGAPGPAPVDPAITSGFGWRADPMTGAPAFHRGLDIRAAYGDAVASVGAGTVSFAGTQRGFGQTVVVDHGGGLETRYAHLSSVSVRAGEPVAAGAVVGRAGRSGRATGTHVHFEATVGGGPVDPALVPDRLKIAGADADVKAGRSESWRKP